MKIVDESEAKDGILIFRKSFRHWRTKKLIVAPPGKVFAFYVKAKK